jgi:septum formation protein
MGAMLPHAFVYLASQSPRRIQLLDQLGVAHRPLLPDRTEDTETLEEALSGELPLDYVRRVTLLKLNAARARLRRRKLPEAPILCADTTVSVGRRILGKPQGPEHAAEMLRALSGRTHRVMTCVVVGVGFGPGVGTGAQHYLDTSLSRVRFAALSETTIQRYVDSGEPQGKAGAYAIQGRIAAWIERIEGSYSGIMGLPLHETTLLLSRARVRLEL